MWFLLPGVSFTLLPLNSSFSPRFSWDIFSHVRLSLIICSLQLHPSVSYHVPNLIRGLTVCSQAFIILKHLCVFVSLGLTYNLHISQISQYLAQFQAHKCSDLFVGLNWVHSHKDEGWMTKRETLRDDEVPWWKLTSGKEPRRRSEVHEAKP